MITCNEKGEPEVRILEIDPNRLKNTVPPYKVRDSKWARDDKPWSDYPVNADKMHTSAETHYFYDLAKRIGSGNFANLGVGRGISTAALAYGVRDNGGDGHVFGVDLFNHIVELTKIKLESIYKDLGLLKYISLCEGFTHDWAKTLNKVTFKFVLIDADHHYETCKQDFELWSPLVEVNGLVAFHDTNINTVDKVISELNLNKWELIEHISSLKVFKKL